MLMSLLLTAKETAENAVCEEHQMPLLRGWKWNDIIHLKNVLGKMRKYKRKSVFRSHLFNLTEEPEKYFHSQLLLHLLWHCEHKLKSTCESKEDHCNSVNNLVDHNAQQFNQHIAHLHKTFHNFVHNGPHETAWGALVLKGKEKNASANDGGSYAVHHVEGYDLTSHEELMLTDVTASYISYSIHYLSMQYTKEACKDTMSTDKYHIHLRNLNPDERNINRVWCKNAVSSIGSGKSFNSYKIFISRPQETGKRHVTDLIWWDEISFFQLTNQKDPDEPLVLLTTPTGSVVFQISAITIHSALQLN